MQWTDMFGYFGAALTLTTFSMKTMLHLRMVGIAANLASIAYGMVGHVFPVLFLHLTLLPLNIWRLHQLLRLTREIGDASASGMSLEWLKPFTQQRSVAAGEVLFRAGDPAADVMFVLQGQFRAVEAGVILARGDVFGELGLISRPHRRSQTVTCERDGVLLLITYDEIRQLYFQNPKFGFWFLELVAGRLTRDAQQATRSPGWKAGAAGTA